MLQEYLFQHGSTIEKYSQSLKADATILVVISNVVYTAPVSV